MKTSYFILGSSILTLSGCITEMGPGEGTLTANRDLKFKTILSSPVEMKAGESRQASFKVDAGINEIQMWIDGKKIVFGWAKGEGDSVVSDPKDTNQDLSGFKLGAKASRKYLDSNTSSYNSVESCTYTVTHQEYVCEHGVDLVGDRDRGDRGRDRDRRDHEDHDRCYWKTIYDTYSGTQPVNVTVDTTNYSFQVDILDSSKSPVGKATGTYADVHRTTTALAPCR